VATVVTEHFLTVKLIEIRLCDAPARRPNLPGISRVRQERRGA
jgi:hypothetical protein